MTCSVDGCDKPVRARGWCITHYTRWKKHGDVGTSELLKDKTNQHPCSICGRVGKTRRGMCNTHYSQWRRVGDPLGSVRTGPGSYVAAHNQIRVVRGPASDHLCVDCGEQAEQWSYSHSAGQRIESRNGPYSLDFENDYEPRCVPCHKAYDRLDTAGSSR